MKTTYKLLMALAAAFLLVPALFAQDSDPYHEKYTSYPSKGVGVNKYLKTLEPDENGEYTLRLETFLTGSVSKTAIPTDFALVLDCSGSMIYDCLFNKERPESITKSQNETEGTADNPNEYYHFLRPAHPAFRSLSHYTYTHGFESGNIGDDMGTSGHGYTAWQYFATGSNGGCALYYYYDADQTYYKIQKETVGSYRRLFINTSNGKLYVYCTQSGGNVSTVLTTTAPSNINNDNKVILIGYEGDNIYRPMSRREALIDGVDAFIDAVAQHNAQDNFASGVTKHQVSIVAFGSGPSQGENNPAEDTNGGSGSRVVKRFREINETTRSEYESALETYFFFRGDTYNYYGMHLARLLLQELQQQPNMGPLNTQNGVNRNKVVVVFTDGEPGTSPTSLKNNVDQTLAEANTIKAVRTAYSGTQINGKVFSIDLSGSANAKRFLEHQSSNYPSSRITSGDSMASFVYSGTAITPAEDRIFYMDANAGGLEEAFKSIVDANTGNTSEHMVAVDVISDSFELPEGVETSGKVKLFTAQCVGKKMIDGQEYLAFTDDVAVDGEGRAPLAEIWFNSENDAHQIVWQKQENYDVDAAIGFVINEKTIIFKGFDFANLWCGLDNDPEHHNTQQISSGMRNYDIRDPKYRGFKLVAEFPIVVAKDALGGPDVPTNVVELSGLFPSDEEGNPGTDPIVNYPEPHLTIPIKLIIKKTGLAQGESASFTIECKKIGTDTWTEFTSFVLTGEGTVTPEIRFINLDPTYYYRVKESGWSWAYENANPTYQPSTESTDPRLINPIVFENTPETNTPKHAEAKAVNKMRSWSESTTTTIYDILK